MTQWRFEEGDKSGNRYFSVGFLWDLLTVYGSFREMSALFCEGELQQNVSRMFSVFQEAPRVCSKAKTRFFIFHFSFICH